MSLVADIAATFFLVLGAFFCLVGAIGMLRMPDFYTRVHAASLIETLGVGFLLLGLMLHAGLTLVAVKLFMIGLLIFFASPTSSHALARAARVSGIAPLLADKNEPTPKNSLRSFLPSRGQETLGAALRVSSEEPPSKP